MSKFILTPSVLNEIVAHAREGKPEEVCGILRGRGNRAFAVVRARNIAPDPVNDYTVDDQTLLKQFEFEETGDEMVAIYHSHPVTPAYPSASDAWNAYYPDCAYLICSLQDEPSPVVRAFRLISHDQPLDLSALTAALDFYETRPGRFAFFQSDERALPPVLQFAELRVPTPFYIVYETDQRGKNQRVRLVSVIEEPLHIEI